MPTKLLFIPLLAAVLFVLFAPAISQDETYHSFADQRTLWGIPNFWNVISNLPALATLAEHYDLSIYAAVPLSGHTVKHFLAAAATAWIMKLLLMTQNQHRQECLCHTS